MKKLFKYQNIGIALLISFLLLIVVKASTTYSISVTEFNDSEFPRVQVSMNIVGDAAAGLMSKHIQIVEAGEKNIGPRVFMPPHSLPTKVNLHILVDTSSRTSSQAELIRANLKAMTQYIFESEISLSMEIHTMDDTQHLYADDLQTAINKLNALNFSGEVVQQIDGFGRIAKIASDATSSGGQNVLLIVNGSDFEDSETNGVSGAKMSGAISAVESNDYLTFVLGHPLRKVHAISADTQAAELIDFSHAVAGGYLGGFGADLTSMVDLLKMQSDNDFVLQYYSTHLTGNFVGSQATLKIDDTDYTFTHTNSPATQLAISHLPENELVFEEDVLIDVDLGHYGKMINAVEVNYENKEGIFETVPLFHRRGESTQEYLRYSGQIPAEVMNDENFSYYISVQTPYSSVGAGGGLITVPVNAYDDGIILKPTLVNNQEVLWTWEGPTVAKGKGFEVWIGDTLLETTSEKHYTIPLTDCNRYQIVQVVVVFANGTKSYPSRPYEYFAETGEDGVITEKDGVTLMIECIEEKEIDTYTKIVANTPGFDAGANLNLERAGIYLAKIIAEDIWRNIEGQAGYYELLYYIMIFIDRDEYQTHGVDNVVINESLIHKLITKVNNTGDINAAYDAALEELSNRLRSTLSM